MFHQCGAHSYIFEQSWPSANHRPIYKNLSRYGHQTGQQADYRESHDKNLIAQSSKRTKYMQVIINANKHCKSIKTEFNNLHHIVSA
jgi:hypothetical protein